MGLTIDSWPNDPFVSGAVPMAQSIAKGNYTYALDAALGYKLAGHLNTGDFVVR